MSEKKKTSVDPGVCPLCGKSNNCAKQTDPGALECWCGDFVFPNELLEQVPEEAVGKACICFECYQKATAK